ncbi:MAG: OmpA family protein [Cyclobacteriaceae bacterium]
MTKYFMLLIGLFWTPLFSQSSGNKDLTLANRSYAMHNYEKAVHHYKAISDKNGHSDFFTELRLSECYSLINNGNAAVFHAQKADRLSRKKSAVLAYVSALAHHKAYHFDEAIRYYRYSSPKLDTTTIKKRIQECMDGKDIMSKKEDAKITNMGRTINSSNHDITPLIRVDDSELYFSSYRRIHLGVKIVSDDIYVSDKIFGHWSSATHVGRPLNTLESDACVGLSHDGQLMFLYKGTAKNRDIYVSEKEGMGWSKPVPIFNAPEMEYSACLSPDGNTIYLVKGVNGQKDLYKSIKKEDGSWSTPVVMSKVVNTPYNERTPYIHPDGKTLFFSSNGHNTMGGFDVFKTTLKNGEWTKPVNLGFPTNTVGDELGYVLSATGTSGYFSSTRKGGAGKYDIYHASLPKNPYYQLALVKGKVKDVLIDKAVGATITVKDKEQNTVYTTVKSNKSTGDYLVSLPTGKAYILTIEKKGVFFEEKEIFIEKGKGVVEVEEKIEIIDANPGVKLVFKNVLFETGHFDLQPEAHKELDRLADVLMKFDTIKVEIAGHTDNVIGVNYNNLELSQYRAASVVQYLVSKGVTSDQVVAKGYGATKPVFSNDSEKGRRLNRRTELVILD